MPIRLFVSHDIDLNSVFIGMCINMWLVMEKKNEKDDYIEQSFLSTLYMQYIAVVIFISYVTW